MFEFFIQYYGNWFLTVIIIWFLSMWFTLSVSYKFINYLKTSQVKHITVDEPEWNSATDENIERILTDIEKNYLCWYSNISGDKTFINDSRELIKDFLKKLLQSSTISNTNFLLYSILNVYLRHLKEFKKSLSKRGLKNEDSVEHYYRFVHNFENKPDAKEFFIYQITMNFLNHFINWELRNSLPCHILDSVLAKKMISNILKNYSDPKYINYLLLKTLTKTDKLQQFMYVNIQDIQHENPEIKKEDVTVTETLEDQNLSDVPPAKDSTNQVPEDENRKKNIIPTNKEKEEPDEVDHCFQNKTFDDDDISKPIASSFINSIFNNSRNSNEFITSPHKEKHIMHGFSDIGTSKLFNEMKSSIKPFSGATINTIQSIKDLQQTTFDNVSQVTSSALHKIGGLQDEAADVVEGIIDFGKKKGGDVSHPKYLPVISLLESNDSPDPEYEEVADLETTIAKLRSLLQQKSSESSMSTPAVSPMPGDDLTQDSSFVGESYEDDTNQKPNSFYKLCAKTATGVIHNTLNTLKTALPNNNSDEEYIDAEKWVFVEHHSSEDDLLNRMKKLLCERKMFCTVDNAYEATETLKEFSCQTLSSNLQIDDDIEDLDVKLPIAKLITDIVCELMLETDTIIIQEPVVKLIMLLLGPKFEKQFTQKFNLFIKNLIVNYRYNPTASHYDTWQLKLDEIVKMLRDSISKNLMFGIGKDILETALKLFVFSLQYQKINEDLFLQIFEFVSLMFIDVNSE